MLKRKHRVHLHKKVLLNLRIFIAISFILGGVVIYEIWTGRMSLFLAIIGVILGIGAGIFIARMYLFTWDKDAKKVISRLDIFGGVILVLYILVSIFRDRIIGQFIQTNYVTGVSLSVATGLMIGRLLGTGHKISSILKEQNLH